MLYLFDVDGTLIARYTDNVGRVHNTWHVPPCQGRTIVCIADNPNVRSTTVAHHAGVACGHIAEETARCMPMSV